MDVYGADPLKDLLKSWNLFRKISPTFADFQAKSLLPCQKSFKDKFHCGQH